MNSATGQNWVIKLPTGADDVVQCDVVGVAQDGSLLCFVQPMGQANPVAIKGFAPGEWKTFHRSTLRMN